MKSSRRALLALSAGFAASAFGLALVRRGNPLGVKLLSWYWHFVDAVWVVVFTVVYVFGR